MPQPLTSDDVTRLLEEVQAGRSGAVDRLYPVVYEQLHHIARAQRRNWNNIDTLNTTALVHEAYLKLADGKPEWESRLHFYSIAARAMRYVLVDYAKRQQAQKRGGDQHKVPLDDALGLADGSPFGSGLAEELISLHDALGKMEREDPRLGQIVEYRIFGGMTTTEIAEALEVSEATVNRQWRAARTWLYHTLNDAAPASSA